MKLSNAGTDATVAMGQRPSKRVALFTGAYNHIADGVSLTLNRLVAHLLRNGVDVLVFAPTIDDPPVDHAGELVPVPSVAALGRREYRISYAFPKDARERFDAFAPDIVHIATPDILGYKALQYAEEHGIPVIASYHTHFTSYLKYYHLNALESTLWSYLRWFYAQCEEVYVPTPSMMEVLKEQGFEDNFRLWERGVETELFNPSRRSLSWRRDHGIEDDDVVIGFVSRLVWEKNLDTYAEVVERLQARGVPHRSLIVGDGPALEELEERLPNTIFTGFLRGEELATAYASSDIFLFPSDTESFGNVILEAMASGLPTVCARATGSSSLVEPGETGYLVPVDDVEAFSERIGALIRDRGLRARLGDAGLRKAQQYEWERVLERMNIYYDQVLERSASASAPSSSLSDATV